MLINNTRSMFDAPKPQEISKSNLIKHLLSIIEEGGELSWLTTDKQSFDWSEVNVNTRQFLKKLSSLAFNMVGIAVFYPETKKTTYLSFKITN